MTEVRNGICRGGPRDGSTLATRAEGVVRHPSDTSGYYVYKSAVGPTPPQWLWIVAKKDESE